MKKEMEITIKSLEDEVTEKQVKYFLDFLRKGLFDLCSRYSQSCISLVFAFLGFLPQQLKWGAGGYFLFVSLICLNVFLLYIQHYKKKKRILLTFGPHSRSK
jgi:hypothetical protein